MQELIEGLGAKLGIDGPTTERVVGIILGTLQSEGPEEGVRKLLDCLPGAAELIAKAGPDGGGAGGILGSALSALGGGGLLMETFGKLQAVGLDMDQAKTAGYEVVAFAREKAGREVVDEVIDAIPALKNLV